MSRRAVVATAAQERRLRDQLWDPAAVAELERHAELAWSPIWTLVPSEEPTDADLAYREAERVRQAARARTRARAEAREAAREAAARLKEQVIAAQFAARAAAWHAKRAAEDARLEATTRAWEVAQAQWHALHGAKLGGAHQWMGVLPGETAAVGLASSRHGQFVHGEGARLCATGPEGVPRCRCGQYEIRWVADGTSDWAEVLRQAAS